METLLAALPALWLPPGESALLGARLVGNVSSPEAGSQWEEGNRATWPESQPDPTRLADFSEGTFVTVPILPIKPPI